MAVAIQEPVTDVDRVAGAAVDIYGKRREIVSEMPLIGIVDVPAGIGALRAVVCASEHIVEIVLDSDVEVASLGPAVWALEAKGWHAVVLVALDRIGDAHRELRGTPCRLQPWWPSGDTMAFGGFEAA